MHHLRHIAHIPLVRNLWGALCGGALAYILYIGYGLGGEAWTATTAMLADTSPPLASPDLVLTFPQEERWKTIIANAQIALNHLEHETGIAVE